jgi:diadenosine tetraphosphate (Ap4A) HIT family hydrolase
MTRTWPEDWEARKRGVGCPFCANQFGTPFYVGSASEAHLERQGIARGHSIVVFRNRHVGDFTSLTITEVSTFWSDVQAVARIIEQVFAPCHMNYQLLGNLVPHLHVHLVPRYVDDPAPGRPIPWEPKRIAQTEFDTQVRLLTEVARTIQSS